MLDNVINQLMECIAGFGYFARFVVIVTAPAVVLLLLALLYLAPRADGQNLGSTANYLLRSDAL